MSASWGDLALVECAWLGWMALSCASAPNHAQGEALPPVSLDTIADGVWVHRSYRVIEPWGLVLSQGLVVRTEGAVLLVDTAWTDSDTATLLHRIEEAAGTPPDRAVVTHAHADKMGGVAALTAAGVRVYATLMTNRDARRRGLTPAPGVLAPFEAAGEPGVYTFGDATAPPSPIEIFYPGPGHTRDNIVVYYAPANVLFGGCLIRPGRSKSLGNTADANIAHWGLAVRAVKARYPNAKVVIPSHGPIGGPELLDHTIALAEAAQGS